MAGGDHFVIDDFFSHAQMALKTFFRAMNDVARIVHAQGHGLFVRPAPYRVLAEPARRWPVAVFAGDAFGNFVRTAALLHGGVKRVTGQALRRLLGFGAQSQNARHAFANVTGQSLKRAAVFVLDDPGGIFILQDAALRNRLHAAVATGGRAGTGANKLMRLVCVRRRARRRGQESAEQ